LVVTWSSITRSLDLSLHRKDMSTGHGWHRQAKSLQCQNSDI
jgi:hypothetical protein